MKYLEFGFATDGNLEIINIWRELVDNLSLGMLIWTNKIPSERKYFLTWQFPLIMKKSAADPTRSPQILPLCRIQPLKEAYQSYHLPSHEEVQGSNTKHSNFIFYQVMKSKRPKYQALRLYQANQASIALPARERPSRSGYQTQLKLRHKSNNRDSNK